MGGGVLRDQEQNLQWSVSLQGRDCGCREIRLILLRYTRRDRLARFRWFRFLSVRVLRWTTLCEINNKLAIAAMHFAWTNHMLNDGIALISPFFSISSFINLNSMTKQPINSTARLPSFSVFVYYQLRQRVFLECDDLRIEFVHAKGGKWYGMMEVSSK